MRVPNNNQNYPVLAAAPGGVQGTFNSTPNGTFTIHYYGNTACDPSGNGEGQTFLGGASVDDRRQRQRDAAALHRRGRHDRDRDGDERDQRHVRVLGVRDGAGGAAVRRTCSLEMTESADPVAFGTPFTWSLPAQNDGPGGRDRRRRHRHAAGGRDARRLRVASRAAAPSRTER